MNVTEYPENKWVTEQYCTLKKCMGGLVVVTISWALTGKSGYTFSINRFTFKTRFETIEDAKVVADDFIAKKVEEYLCSKVDGE